MFHCGQIGNCNPILEGIESKNGFDCKNKYFADILIEKWRWYFDI